MKPTIVFMKFVFTMAYVYVGMPIKEQLQQTTKTKATTTQKPEFPVPFFLKPVLTWHNLHGTQKRHIYRNFTFHIS